MLLWAFECVAFSASILSDPKVLYFYLLVSVFYFTIYSISLLPGHQLSLSVPGTLYVRSTLFHSI